MKRYGSLRDTGIPWLGRVPSHWTAMRLKDAVEGCINGIWGEDPVGDDTDTPVVRVADFDRAHKVATVHPTMRSIKAEQVASRELQHGDLIIEKSGGGEQQPVGMVVRYLGSPGAVTSNFVARMRPRDIAVGGYLNYLHAHFYERSVTKLSIKQSTGIQNLDSASYLAETCFLPPLPEQASIVSYLDNETARIDVLMRQKERELELLRELRSATITDAVLGRIDVSSYGIEASGEKAST